MVLICYLGFRVRVVAEKLQGIIYHVANFNLCIPSFRSMGGSRSLYATPCFAALSLRRHQVKGPTGVLCYVEWWAPLTNSTVRLVTWT